MDKDTHVSLHRSRLGRIDKMLKSGRFDDLYQEFKGKAARHSWPTVGNA
jgi:hypothetical protein